MIVKKLRDQNNWSQEQLAEISGLNVRTIQRVESGQKASLETLKCLASVLEIDISKLTEVITVIDRESDSWKDLPWWFRFNMWGCNTRQSLFRIEIILMSFAFLSWFVAPDSVWTPLVFLNAFVPGWLVRYGDMKKVW